MGPTLIANQTSAAGRYRGPRGFGRWLAQGRHDQVTLSAALVAVKKFLIDLRNCVSRLHDLALIGATRSEATAHDPPPPAPAGPC
jgi:hypothetical protein